MLEVGRPEVEAKALHQWPERPGENGKRREDGDLDMGVDAVVELFGARLEPELSFADPINLLPVAASGRS